MMLDISAVDTSIKRRKEKLLPSSSAVPIMQIIKNKCFVKTKLEYNCGINKETHFFYETRTVECVVRKTERADSASA